MPEHCYAVVMTVRGPILTASSVTQAIGIDIPAARRVSDGKYYLAGSLIRGKLREQAELLGLARVTGLFGREAGNKEKPEEAFDPVRSKIFFTDFVDPLARSAARRTRICVDDDRGAVNEQMLAVLESPYEPGTEAEFTGSIRFYSPDGDRVEIERELKAALRAISSVGSQRTAGFGRVAGVELRHSAAAGHGAAAGGQKLPLALSTSDLICVARVQPADNLFESSQDLPGNAIKGAIATTWCLRIGKDPQPITAAIDPSRKELGAVFERIRFRHGRPVEAGCHKRPLRAPLSMIRIGAEWKDTALLNRNPGGWTALPSFEPDWKDGPPSLFGEARVPVELRVRTKMDRETRRAEDQKLFAYEMLSPGERLQWLTYVDFPADAPAAAITQLQNLLGEGIDAFGKTKAKLNCGTFDADAAGGGGPQARDGWYVVVLQTPALLNDPQQYNADLMEDYKIAWRDLSGGALDLSHFKARQELAGGLYQQRRFGGGEPYRPWLLTQAGSVFVLKPTGSGAEEAVREWLGQGLKLPSSVASFYGLQNSAADWSRCPYIRENGFGEVAVNADLHWDYRLK